MKITLDPMPMLRAKAEEAVNAHFNRIAAERLQRDHEHARKRAIAEMVLAGGEAPATFVEEAALMGLPADELARTILAKPDEVMERGLKRRRIILAIRAARTPAALERIFDDHAIPRPTAQPMGL